MSHLRRLTLLGIAGLGAAVLAGPALAARPALPKTVTTTHFVVHYSTAGASPISFAQASDVAAIAERVYAAELADGYPAPASDVLVDGDPHIDIFVDTASVSGAEAGLAKADNAAAAQSSGYIVLAATAASMSTHAIATELFHLIQFGIYDFTAISSSDSWLMSATAEWMGYAVDGYNVTTFPLDIRPSDTSLDCFDPVPSGIGCSTVVYEGDGYSRWPFFEYLSEKYGVAFIKDIFTQAAGAPTSATNALANALAAKGTTLADAYNAWATLRLTSGYSTASLQKIAPDTYGATTETGTKPGTLLTETVAVNHLATRYLEFERGDGTTTGACYYATLSVTVAMPAGTLSQPTFFWNGSGSTPVPLSINGSTASANLPWDTCTWAGVAGFLSLPNASTAVDGASFVVTASMTVDTTDPVTVSPPPDPVSVSTPVVPVVSVDSAPQISVFGPELIKLSAAERGLRLLVESSGQGSLRASIGTVSLGNVQLRGGNNDVRLTLPLSMVSALRRSASTSNVLTLTPVSASGAVAGPAVTRTISIAPAKTAAKPKAKAKPKPKSAHK